MAILKRSRTAQYPLVQEFVFNFDDGMANLTALNGSSVEANGRANVTDFGSGAATVGLLTGLTHVPSAFGNTYYFEIMSLPVGAQIIGGDVQVEVAYAGPTAATISLGDSSSGTLYASGVDLKTLGRTALTIPAEVTGAGAVKAAAGLDVRMTLNYTVAQATAGRVRVRVMYTLDGRMNEVSPT